MILFSAEWDDGTAVLLQLLPQNRSGILVGKLAAAVFMATIVLMVLTAVGIVFADFRAPDTATWLKVAPSGMVFLIEALLWGVLVSLSCPNPLLAVALAFAAASFSSQLAIQISIRGFGGFSLEDFQAAIPARLALAAAAGLLDVWLGLRWLEHREDRPRLARWWNRAEGQTDRDFAAARSNQNVRSRWLSCFARLTWQTVRQSWKSILAAVVIALFLSASVELMFNVGRSSMPSSLRFDLPLTVLFVPALVGALTFRADQRNRQYRFLAEHAGRPLTLWIARQAVGLLVILTIGVVIHVLVWNWLDRAFVERIQSVIYRFESTWNQVKQVQLEFTIAFAWNVTWAAWAAWFTSYSVGQLCSLVIRSPVLAAMLSLGASIPLLLWTYVVVAWQLPVTLFILPIAFAAFAASRLRVEDWLSDRNSLVRWLLPAGAVVIPIVIMLALVPKARLAQVAGRVMESNGQFGLQPTLGQSSLGELARNAETEFELGRQVMDGYFLFAARLAETDDPDFGALDMQLQALSTEVCRLRGAWRMTSGAMCSTPT
jgi:hypothetical protein